MDREKFRLSEIPVHANEDCSYLMILPLTRLLSHDNDNDMYSGIYALLDDHQPSQSKTICTLSSCSCTGCADRPEVIIQPLTDGQHHPGGRSMLSDSGGGRGWGHGRVWGRGRG